MHRRSTSVIMVSKWLRLFLLVLFVTSFSSKSFGINICPTREITQSSGYITSPNYPSYYYNNINCTLTLRAPFGFSFRFTFTKLDLETRIGQCYDYVKISGIFSRLFCNKITPFNFNPGGNVVTVQMYSDASYTRDGIRLQFVRYLSGTTPTPTPAGKVCDYRLGTTSCPWHNEKTSDDFDWSIGRGSTSSSNTGPSTDSKGSIYGKYFFLEASSPRQLGDKAWLVSQNFSYSRKCLIFYYHMYGNNIGSLNVYKKIYGSKYKIWSKSGNHGNSWFKAQVDVNGVNYNYKIIIEGVRGYDFEGDIAVDDIELKDGYCNVQSTTPLYSFTAVPTWQRTYARGCTFQNGLRTTICPWRNIDYDGYTYDDFDWTVGSGSTNSYYTGPGFDKYNSAFGKYAYMEASSQRRGDKAWLVSDYFKSSTTCFTFSYYNYEISGGLLKVYQQISGSTKTLKWTATPKSRAFKWFDVNITIPHTGFNSEYRIIVEGIKGSGYYVNIAVDEFAFTTGACGYVPSYTSTASNKSHSTRNIAIISGASGGLVLLLIIGMVIIYYVRQKNGQRNSTSSTTQPGSAQNPTYQANQHGNLQNPTYSSNQQNTMTGTPPPKYESLCNTSPFYIHATPGFTNHGANPHLVPAANLGQNVYTVPMSTIVPGDNRNPNPSPGKMVRNKPTSIAPVENVVTGGNVY